MGEQPVSTSWPCQRALEGRGSGRVPPPRDRGTVPRQAGRRARAPRVRAEHWWLREVTPKPLLARVTPEEQSLPGPLRREAEQQRCREDIVVESSELELSCVASGKSLACSGPQFSSLQNALAVQTPKRSTESWRVSGTARAWTTGAPPTGASVVCRPWADLRPKAGVQRPLWLPSRGSGAPSHD